MAYTTPTLFNFDDTNSQATETISSAAYNSNFGNAEISLSETRALTIELLKYVRATETSFYIRSYTNATLGSNSIAFAANGVTGWNDTTETGITGWPAKTFNTTSNPIEMANNFSGYLWIVWDGASSKDYAITNRTNAPLANHSLLGLYSINGSGVVTVSYFLERPFERGLNYWRENQTFLKDVAISGNITANGNITASGDITAPNNTNRVYALPTNYHDVRIDYTDANTITVLAGSRVRSSDDTTDIIFSANLTCALNVSGVNGLDTGSEAANTWYYLYAIYNPTTLTSALLFSTVNEAVSGSITLPSGYTKKRQLRFAVRNNASSNIIPFFYQSNFLIRYDGRVGISGDTEVLNTATATTFTDVVLSSFVPPISKIAVLHAFRSQAAGGQGTRFRRKGDATEGFEACLGAGVVGEGQIVKFDLATDSSQTIQYRNVASGATWLNVLGYYITEIK